MKDLRGFNTSLEIREDSFLCLQEMGQEVMVVNCNKGHFMLGSRQIFILAVQAMKDWNRLPRQVVRSPSLTNIKSGLDRRLAVMV